MNRLEKLKELEQDLRELMSKSNSRTYASLAKQYRETLKEIEEIEQTYEQDDEVGRLLTARKSDSVSQNRTEL